MTVWQKVTTAVASLSEGLGAMLGSSGQQSVSATGARRDVGVAFTAAIVALGAKMAKADGVVVRIEVDVFNRVFQTPPEEASHVARLFDLAKQDTAGFEIYADRIRKLLHDDQQLLADVLEGLFHIASADRALHPGEDRFLQTVARQFNLSESTFRFIRARFVADDSNPFDVLGLDHSATNDEIKKRHKKLVRENHPDLATARGLPPDFVALQNRKLAAINAAYAILAKERGL
jgi:DnaJ like chaperone protein